jgi:hypothetical protein
LDETCVKVNGLEYWVYAALDVDRNEIYESSSSKYSYHQQFIDVKLLYWRTAFIVDNVYGLTCIGGVRINIQYKAPSDRSLVESYTHHSAENKSILQQHNIKPTKQKREV